MIKIPLCKKFQEDYSLISLYFIHYFFRVLFIIKVNHVFNEEIELDIQNISLANN